MRREQECDQPSILHPKWNAWCWSPFIKTLGAPSLQALFGELWKHHPTHHHTTRMWWWNLPLCRLTVFPWTCCPIPTNVVHVTRRRPASIDSTKRLSRCTTEQFRTSQLPSNLCVERQSVQPKSDDDVTSSRFCSTSDCTFGQNQPSSFKAPRGTPYCRTRL